MSVIDVQDLKIRYAEVSAVDGLNLTVERGEVVGLLGGNGAGKSSTLRAIAGVNPPTSGQLNVAGNDMSDPQAVELGRAAVGYCPDVGGLLRQATPREHIGLALALRGNSNLWPHALELAEQFDVAHVLDRVTAGFSHGMCRRLSVLLAALTAQEVLVLDEPFDGVDPLGVDATLDVVRLAKERGLGVLISTHLLGLVTVSSDRVVVMAAGRAVDADVASAFAGDSGRERYTDLLRAAR